MGEAGAGHRTCPYSSSEDLGEELVILAKVRDVAHCDAVAGGFDDAPGPVK